MSLQAYSREEKILWLQLLRTPYIGPSLFQVLFQRYLSVENIIAIFPQLSKKIRNTPKLYDYFLAEKELEYLEKKGGGVLTWKDSHYSHLLRNIPLSPPVLCYLGNMHLMNSSCIAVVGTRNPSANGKQLTYQITQELANNHYTIVSGLAKGVDAVAHFAALKNPSPKTIAVLGCGVDIIYPMENKELYKKILECQGLILSEFPTGTKPIQRNFPKRNRIISGLSLGVVITEAALQSGSLITANFSLEQGREVFAVPGFPLDYQARGTNQLLKNSSAHLVENAEDILEILKSNPYLCDVIQEMHDVFASPQPFPLFPHKASSVLSFPSVEAPRTSEKIQNFILKELNGKRGVSFDYLFDELDIEYSLLLDQLIELELNGTIQQTPQKTYILTTNNNQLVDF